MPDFLALLIWDPAYAYFLAQGAFAKPNRALSPNQFGSAFCGSGSKSDTSSIGCFSHLSITKSHILTSLCRSGCNVGKFVIIPSIAIQKF